MSEATEERGAITASMQGDIVEVTIGEITWRIRITFKLDAVILSDANSREPLCQGNISDICIARTGNRYRPKMSDCAKMPMGFVGAWMVLEPGH